MIGTVAMMKGGEGKTTTAVSLAVLAVEAGWRRVILVDADAQGTAAEWAEETGGFPGVELLEAPSPRLVRQAAAMDSPDTLVLIDTPHQAEEIIATAIDVAHAVVVPYKAAEQGTSRIWPTVNSIPAEIPRGIVITAAERTTVLYKTTVGELGGVGLELWGSIPKRVAVGSAMTGGLPADVLDAYRPVLDQLTKTRPEVTAR